MQRTITQVNFVNEDEINVEIETYGGEFWMSFSKSGKFKGFWDANHTKPMTKNEAMGLLRKTFARIHREELRAAEEN